jgi:hypothetical protein
MQKWPSYFVVFWVFVCVLFCTCDKGFSIGFMLYSFFCIMLLYGFSRSLYLFVIGFMCNRFSKYLIPDSFTIRYLEVTVLRRGVREVLVVAARAPAC